MTLEDDFQSFRRQGYCVLSEVLSSSELTGLRSAADSLMAEPADRRTLVSEKQGDGRVHDIERGDDRRFLRMRHEDLPDVESFLFGDRMVRLASTFAGHAPHLFVEQFVVKGPTTGAGFAWHQDSGYVGFEHDPYMSFWIALDDTTEENGCLYVLPRDLDRDHRVDEHVWDEVNKERIGYHGDDPGVSLPCRAGTIVAFSSLTMHRSGPNTTSKSRRVYLCQFSRAPLIDPATGNPKHLAKPVLRRS